MSFTSNKERTSISIDPDLLKEAKDYCKTKSLTSGTKFPFSELVTKALKEYIRSSPKEDTVFLTAYESNGYQTHV